MLLLIGEIHCVVVYMCSCFSHVCCSVLQLLQWCGVDVVFDLGDTLCVGVYVGELRASWKVRASYVYVNG